MPLILFKTCQFCGDVFESRTERKTCSGYCQWRLSLRTRSENKRNAEEKKRIDEVRGRNTVLSFFEDVIV